MDYLSDAEIKHIMSNPKFNSDFNVKTFLKFLIVSPVGTHFRAEQIFKIFNIKGFKAITGVVIQCRKIFGEIDIQIKYSEETESYFLKRDGKRKEEIRFKRVFITKQKVKIYECVNVTPDITKEEREVLKAEFTMMHAALFPDKSQKLFIELMAFKTAA